MNWLIALPAETQTAIVGIFVGLVALAVKWVGSKWPWLGALLEAYATEWGMALAAIVIAWVQNTLPGGDLAGISVLAVQLVVAVIVYVLGKLGLGAAGVNGFTNT